MLDPKNMGTDTEIMPLSYLEPEIMFSVLNGGHFEIQDGGRRTQIPAWQTTYHDSGDRRNILYHLPTSTQNV